MTEIAIIGGGPAGVMCALNAAQNTDKQIFLFDNGIILNTLLPTGGGRCNLAYAEYDFKELVKFYPRGEKFLYSIFSRFSTPDTINFFEKIGIKIYTQNDNRIFPVSNSSKDVKNALTKQIEKHKNIKKVFEEVIDIQKQNNQFLLKTNKKTYLFDKVVIATGGRGSGQKLAQKLGHKITELKPALCSLITCEKEYACLTGISIKDIEASVFFKNKKFKELKGDFLFTHKGISGPVVYKISSYCAYLNFNEKEPLKIVFNLAGKDFENFDCEFSKLLKKHPQKASVNILSGMLPSNLVLKIFETENVDPKTRAGQLTKKDREKISKKITNFILHAKNVSKGEEIVTAGGVDLKEINPKTLESKIVSGLYFCGEVLDIDGLTGGFNLQNCWSTGFVAGTQLAQNT